MKACVDQFRALTDTKEASNELTYWPVAPVAVGANGPYRGDTVRREHEPHTLPLDSTKSPCLVSHF